MCNNLLVSCPLAACLAMLTDSYGTRKLHCSIDWYVQMGVCCSTVIMLNCCIDLCLLYYQIDGAEVGAETAHVPYAGCIIQPPQTDNRAS